MYNILFGRLVNPVITKKLSRLSGQLPSLLPRFALQLLHVLFGRLHFLLPGLLGWVHVPLAHLLEDAELILGAFGHIADEELPQLGTR